MYRLLAFTLLAPAAAFQPADKHALKDAIDVCCRNPVTNLQDPMGIFDNDCKVTSLGLYSPTGTHIKDWDTSLITDMSLLFKRDGNCPEETINANISQWDTSQVTDMYAMFHGAKVFNQPLPWDTSNVINMSYIFFGAHMFSHPLPWDTSSVQHNENMFTNTCNNWNVNNWNAFVTQSCDLTSASHEALSQEITKPTRTTAYQLAGLCEI